MLQKWLQNAMTNDFKITAGTWCYEISSDRLSFGDIYVIGLTPQERFLAVQIMISADSDLTVSDLQSAYQFEFNAPLSDAQKLYENLRSSLSDVEKRSKKIEANLTAFFKYDPKSGSFSFNENGELEKAPEDKLTKIADFVEEARPTIQFKSLTDAARRKVISENSINSVFDVRRNPADTQWEISSDILGLQTIPLTQRQYDVIEDLLGRSDIFNNENKRAAGLLLEPSEFTRAFEEVKRAIEEQDPEISNVYFHYISGYGYSITSEPKTRFDLVKMIANRSRNTIEEAAPAHDSAEPSFF